MSKTQEDIVEAKKCIQSLIATRELYPLVFDKVYNKGLSLLDEFRSGQKIDSLVDSLYLSPHLVD